MNKEWIVRWRRNGWVQERRCATEKERDAAVRQARAECDVHADVTVEDIPPEATPPVTPFELNPVANCRQPGWRAETLRGAVRVTNGSESLEFEGFQVVALAHVCDMALQRARRRRATLAGSEYELTLHEHDNGVDVMCLSGADLMESCDVLEVYLELLESNGRTIKSYTRKETP